MRQTIENEASGERITFLPGAAGTGGAYTEGLVTLPPGSAVQPMHCHPFQDQYFEALDGRLGLTVGKRVLFLQPGDSFVVPAGTPHNCFAPHGAPVRYRSIWKPSLHIEYLLREVFASANRRRRKTPSPFDAAYILQQLKNEYRLTGRVPGCWYAMLFATLIFWGKILGRVKAEKIY